MITFILYVTWLCFKWLMIATWYLTKWTFKFFILPWCKVLLMLLSCIFKLAGVAIGLPFTIFEKLIPSVK